MIRENISRLQQQISQACKRAGRKFEEVRLVAVTKKVPLEHITEAVDFGLNEIAESRVQEAQDKFQGIHALKPDLKWHLIGQLQSNKVNRAVEIFDLIQSVDSAKLIGRIDRRASEIRKIQDCLLEVKVSEEPAKTGLPETELDSFFSSVQSLKHVRILGLMCIPPYFKDPNHARPYFAKSRKIFEKYFVLGRDLGVERPILSMGMSHDFEIAIEEGSTMLRIGTAIFGPRS